MLDIRFQPVTYYETRSNLQQVEYHLIRTMLIIPAIDLMSSKVVRLYQGKFAHKQIYADDACQVAQRWERLGAKRLHIVDLDGARIGNLENLPVVEEITKRVKIPVELGGGIRDREKIEQVFAAGVKWVVLGTRALQEPEFLLSMSQLFPGRIILSLDVKDEKLYIRGWKESLPEDIFSYLDKIKSLKLESLIITDIRRDGTLEGLNIELFREICQKSAHPVIVAGGVSSLEDLKSISEMKGLKGTIIGKALYERKIDLGEALEISKLSMQN